MEKVRVSIIDDTGEKRETGNNVIRNSEGALARDA